MGSNTSKPTRDNRDIEKFEYVQDIIDDDESNELSLRFSHSVTLNELEIQPTQPISSYNKDVKDEGKFKSNPVILENLPAWETALISDPKNQLTINALSTNPIPSVIKSHQKTIFNSTDVWNTAVGLEGSPITSQNSSGRCWLFASTNVFRTYYARKFELDSFELSQSYLFFYDKLEKANYLLTNIIETADFELSSRVVQCILSNGLSDGGQWDMVVNLVNKYGLVPKTAYGESFHSGNTEALNYFLVNKVKEFALILRDLVKDEKTSKEKINQVKDSQLRQIYDILALSLGGPPPKPEDKFIWDYKDKTGKAYSIETSPKQFTDLVDLDLNGTFSLINDPRNAYEKLYTVDRVNNVVGGKPIDYVNVAPGIMKKVIIANLKDNTPVFFGSDVGKFQDRGILDPGSYDHTLLFNTSLSLSKAERLQVGASAMTHAMVITAVHIVDGKIQRYRIENSWGENVGNKGYFVATDEWFDQYVYQVVSHERYIPKYLVEVWKKGEYTVLPIYDPMGALA